jgi:hypothetical protein
MGQGRQYSRVTSAFNFFYFCDGCSLTFDERQKNTRFLITHAAAKNFLKDASRKYLRLLTDEVSRRTSCNRFKKLMLEAQACLRF